jgi:hypothetical protein
VRKDTIVQAVENIDVQGVIVGLLRSKREIIRLQTLTFIFDRVQGKPKQDVSVSGGLVHAVTRDPRLATLPQEALLELARAYDDILVKHLPNAGQDGPQNQTESTPAIEAEVTERGVQNCYRGAEDSTATQHFCLRSGDGKGGEDGEGGV